MATTIVAWHLAKGAKAPKHKRQNTEPPAGEKRTKNVVSASDKPVRPPFAKRGAGGGISLGSKVSVSPVFPKNHIENISQRPATRCVTSSVVELEKKEENWFGLGFPTSACQKHLCVSIAMLNILGTFPRTLSALTQNRSTYYGGCSPNQPSSSPSASSSSSSPLSSALSLRRFFATGSWPPMLFRFLLAPPLSFPSSPFSPMFSLSSPPISPSIAATSSAVKNRPPGPRGRRMACLCRLSCRYGFRPLLVRRRASSNFCLATRRLRIRWNCFALTYSGDSSTAPGAGIGSGDGGCCCWGGGGGGCAC